MGNAPFCGRNLRRWRTVLSEKVVNGTFTGAATSWSTIATYTGYNYADNKINGDSAAAATTDVSYGYYQTIAISGTVLGATISAWRRYESQSGNTHDGHVTSTLQIKKPDTTVVTVATETKTAETGEGYIASAADVKAIINSGDGNYDVRLITTVASANQNTEGAASVINPYGDWTNSGMVMDNLNCYVVSNSGDDLHVEGYVEKTFVVDVAPSTASISLDAQRIVNSEEPTVPGHASFTVTLEKIGGTTTTLYTGDTGDNNWHTILDNMDILSYITTSGTYKLKCYALVASGYSTTYPVLWWQSWAYFGNCNLQVTWGGHVYTKSYGYWDNISLNVVSSVGTTTTETQYIDIIDSAEVFLVSADTQMTGLSSIGKTYTWSGQSDNGTPFYSYWRSKDLDFAEILGEGAHNIHKTINRVRLIYEDMDSSVPVSVSISPNGGSTWVTKAATIGTGSGLSKYYDFDFSPDQAVTGYFITFIIQAFSSTLEFKWTGISAEFSPRGPAFDAATV